MEAKNLSRKEQALAVASERFTEKIIADILEGGKSGGIFNLDDCQLTASVVKAMLQDWYLKRSKYRKRNISVDHYSEFVLQFVEAFILPQKTQNLHLTYLVE
jgi:TetR/AcrR family transcriptional regulator, cholesterol catabolism regulator